jgi:chemotaxis-related protein WspB
MLFVLFQLGNDRYALEASHVVEVVPLLALKKFPQAPKGVAGLFVYRGQPVPAVDLCELLLGRPAQERLSTRIVVVDCRSALGGRDGQLLGLIAEHATGTMRRDTKEFRDVGVAHAGTPFLGPVLTDERGVIQLVHAQKLLTVNIGELLFASNKEPGHVAD